MYMSLVIWDSPQKAALLWATGLAEVERVALCAMHRVMTGEKKSESRCRLRTERAELKQEFTPKQSFCHHVFTNLYNLIKKYKAIPEQYSKAQQIKGTALYRIY